MKGTAKRLKLGEIIKLDIDGDIILSAGDRSRRCDMLASAKVLSIASPVFKAMLLSSFSEREKVSVKDPGRIKCVS